MNTRIIQCILPILAFGWTACRQAEPVIPEAPSPQYCSVPVQLGQSDDTDEGTRSLVSIEVENFQKAALFAMDPESGTVLTYGENAGDMAGGPVAILTEEPTFHWALPIGTAMDIYAIVNYGSLDLKPFFKQGMKCSELESLRFTSNGPSELRMLESSGQGLPMAGIKRKVTLSSAGDGLTVRVKKLYAKYNLYFDLSRVEAEGWHVQAMHMIVENANTEVPYFSEQFCQTDASKLVEYDRATETDLDMLQQGSQVTLYMLENCQGRKEGAESWKTVCKDLGFAAMKNCTYVDLSVKVQREGGEYQNLGYAIYLGKTDMRSDFDIERNLFKTVRIVLPGTSDPIPASRFFRFSGTDSPTVAPGETIDLYFVTNLEEKEITASCNPEGFLTPVQTVYKTGTDGIATGYIRFQAAESLEEGDTGIVTAGSQSRDATDQKTVTASWPIILDADTSQAPVYVAQKGYLQVVPTGPIAKTEAEVKSGSEGILRIGPSDVSGSICRIGLSALAAGTGTLVLHHYNAAGTEIGSQETDITILAPQLRFNAGTYRLSPVGTYLAGTLSCVRPDGTEFTAEEKARFDLPLIKTLLFPSTQLSFDSDTPFAEAVFTRREDSDFQALQLPFQLRIARFNAGGKELDCTGNSAVDRMRYGAAPSTGIGEADADVTVSNPFEGLVGKSLAVIENNLPVYYAFQQAEDHLKALRKTPEDAFAIKSYRNGTTFSKSGSSVSLKVELPVKPDCSVVMDSPAEFDISYSSGILTLTAHAKETSYEAIGRYALKGHIRHSVTGELSPALDMGYLEIYLIGAVAPRIREKGQDYEICGTLVPAGSSSPFTSLTAGRLSFQENTDFTERCISESGLLYKAPTASGYNLYYQSEDVDENGITRYAAKGETAYLNSYRFTLGTWAPDVVFLEFGFGMIYLDNFHDHDLFTASQECRTMTKVNILSSSRKEALYHLRNAEAKDGNGFAYCALASLFGGDGIYNYDLFL